MVVVGTRRQERSSAQSPVPVDVIAARQLRSQGDGDMLDVLASQVPSYNVGREPISDAATLLRPANLRGMPADSTLILVNGKRRHRGGVIGDFVAGINKGAQAVDIAPLAGIAMKRSGARRTSRTSSLFSSTPQSKPAIGELYGFDNWSGRDVDGSFFYRNPNTRTGVFADRTGSLLVADLTPNDAAACERVAVADRLADRSALARVMADPNCFVYSEWFPGASPRASVAKSAMPP